MRFTVALLFFAIFFFNANAQKNPDAILGKWISEERNLEVKVYKTGTEYKAKVLWFDDSDDKSKPWNTRTDDKNPNKELRSKKITDLDVLTGLIYKEDDDEWINGVIYDSKTGKTWSAKVWINKNNQLKVRGYWLMSFLGETMSFNKE
jgi:uncharacterized protein (DUF2147 family)